jgi:hypothetical protein
MFLMFFYIKKYINHLLGFEEDGFRKGNQMHFLSLPSFKLTNETEAYKPRTV